VILLQFTDCFLLSAVCNRDDLKSRLERKSPLAQYIGSLYDASASFMLLNPVTVEVILRYVANLCRQLSECEALINASTGSRGSTTAIKDAKVRLGRLQQEVEKVCHLLVTVGKHSSRSFTDVAGTAISKYSFVVHCSIISLSSSSVYFAIVVVGD
jgi:hypothetical protein